MPHHDPIRRIAWFVIGPPVNGTFLAFQALCVKPIQRPLSTIHKFGIRALEASEIAGIKLA